MIRNKLGLNLDTVFSYRIFFGNARTYPNIEPFIYSTVRAFLGAIIRLARKELSGENVLARVLVSKKKVLYY
jgi:hypothetical protein